MKLLKALFSKKESEDDRCILEVLSKFGVNDFSISADTSNENGMIAFYSKVSTGKEGVEIYVEDYSMLGAMSACVITLFINGSLAAYSDSKKIRKAICVATSDFIDAQRRCVRENELSCC